MEKIAFQKFEVIKEETVKCIDVFNSQFPDEEEETVESAARMLGSLHSLPDSIAFNVAFFNEELRIFFTTSRNQTISVDDAIFSSYQFSEVSRVENPIFNSKLSSIIFLKPAIQNIALKFLVLKDFTETDPLAYLTNAVFNERGEDALIQIIFQGIKDAAWRKKIEKIENKIVKDPNEVGIMRFILPGLYGADTMGRVPVPPTVQKDLMAMASKKQGVAFSVNINLSAQSEERARDLLHVLDVFGSINWIQIAKIKNIFSKEDLSILLNPIIDKSRSLLMVSDELATLVHLPSKKVKTPTIKNTTVRVLTIPPKTEGVRICNSYLRGKKYPVRVSPEDLATHYTVLGSTGTGKSTFIENMAGTFLEQGWGFAVVDPQDGRLLKRIAALAKKHNREKDIVWFNPFNDSRVITLNPLCPWIDFDPESLASLLTDSFYRVWRTSWGPRLAYLLHMALLAVLTLNLETQKREILGNKRATDFYYTLEDVFYLYLDQELFKDMVQELENYNYDVAKELNVIIPLLKSNARNWVDIVSPILNKMGVFTLNEGIKNVFNAGSSSIDIRSIVKNNKILLIDLKTRKAKDIAVIIGNVLITLIYQALQETISMRKNLYGILLDEAHNFAGEALSTMLQEGRQIGVSITSVTQFVGSLLTDSPEETQKVREAFLSVPRNFVQFGTNDIPDDILEKFNSKLFSKSDFNLLPRFLAYAIISVFGKQVGPTVISAEPLSSFEEINAVNESDYFTDNHLFVEEIRAKRDERKEQKEQFEIEKTMDAKEKLLTAISLKIRDIEDEEVKNILIELRGVLAEGHSVGELYTWKILLNKIENMSFVSKINPAFTMADGFILKSLEATEPEVVSIGKLLNHIKEKLRKKIASISSPSLWHAIKTILYNECLSDLRNLGGLEIIESHKVAMKEKIEKLNDKVDVSDYENLLKEFQDED